MPGTNQNTGRNYSFTPYVSEVKGELDSAEPEEKLKLIKEKLPGLSNINANDPGSGYRNFELLSETHSEDDLESHLHESASNIIHFQYAYESEENVKNIHNGELVDVTTLTAHLIDIYWYGSVMLFSGESESVSKARNRLQSDLVGELRIEKVSFSTEILNEILEDKYGERFLNNKKPEITDIRSLTAKGNENVSQVSIHGGKGLETYEKYLEDASKVTQMIATFNFLDYSILANISESTIHIYTISPDENLENSDKLLVSILFSAAFIRIFRGSQSRGVK